MRLHLVLILTLSVILGPLAWGAYEKDDLPRRPAGQQVLPELQLIVSPDAASATQVLSAHAGATSAAAVSVTTFAGQPDVSRNLTVASGGTTADVAACIITVSGRDIRSGSISETFTFADNEAATKTGNKAFKSVSSVAFPANCEDGTFAATWNVGMGTKLGLNRCLDKSGYLAFAVFNGIFEGTRPTIAVHSSLISSNTAILNSALDGSDVALNFFHNYRCLP
jgi:hypothetical protein